MTLVDGATSLNLTVSNSNRDIPGVVVRSYDLGFPAVREIVNDEVDQDGTQDSTAFFGSRVVRLECSIHDTPGVTKHQLYETLRTMCLPSHRPQLVVQCDGWTQPRTLVMRGTPASCVVSSKHATFLEASLGWVVPTGVMLASQPEISIQPDRPGVVGVSFPITFPVQWTPGSLSDRAIATNTGNTPWGWTATYWGQANGIAISNKTTGGLFIVNTNIPAGHFLRVDSRAKTALIDNDPSNSVFNSIDFTQSSWWALQPGDNTISVTAQASDTNSVCYFDFSSAWA